MKCKSLFYLCTIVLSCVSVRSLCAKIPLEDIDLESFEMVHETVDNLEISEVVFGSDKGIRIRIPKTNDKLNVIFYSPVKKIKSLFSKPKFVLPDETIKYVSLTNPYSDMSLCLDDPFLHKHETLRDYGVVDEGARVDIFTEPNGNIKSVGIIWEKKPDGVHHCLSFFDELDKPK